MRPGLRRGFFAGSIVVAIWCIMVLYWRRTERMPASSDLLAGLLVLPAAFLATVWLLRKSASGVSDLAAPSASAAPGDAPASCGTAAQPVAPRAWVSILAGAIRSPHADTADALAEALRSGEAELTLDLKLKNLAGMPVRAGRVAGIDTDRTMDALTAWSIEANQQLPNLDDEPLRCLAMGGEICAELASLLTAHPLCSAYRDSSKTARSRIALPSLELVTLWPANWSAELRRFGDAWLLHQIAQHGWPPEKTVLGIAGDAAAGTAVGSMEHCAHALSRKADAGICLLVACDSSIGASSMLEWGQGTKLAKRGGAGGQVPGEGAAALLLAAGAETGGLPGLTPAALYQAAQGRRARSAERGAAAGDALLEGLAKQAVLAAGLEFERIGLLVADTDQRGSRAAELAALGSSLLPELDLREDCFQVAAYCGAAGAASTLTSVVLAWQGATVGLNCLCLSNQDPYHCAAAVVRPTPVSISQAT